MPIKIHERETAVMAGLRYDISTAINRAIEKHDPTNAELLSVLAQSMVAWTSYAIRDERER